MPRPRGRPKKVRVCVPEDDKEPLPIRDELPLNLGTKPRSERTSSLVEKVILSDESPVDMRDLSAELMHLFKGPKGIAQQIYDQYEKTTDKPRERANLMSVIYRIIDHGKADDSIAHREDVSDTDLELAMLDIMKRHGILPGSQMAWVDHFCI